MCINAKVGGFYGCHPFIPMTSICGGHSAMLPIPPSAASSRLSRCERKKGSSRTRTRPNVSIRRQKMPSVLLVQYNIKTLHSGLLESWQNNHSNQVFLLEFKKKQKNKVVHLSWPPGFVCAVLLSFFFF